MPNEHLKHNFMGRPRLHHSLKEQTEAARAYRRTYYRRNREEFRLKNKERYLQRKCRSRGLLNGESEGTNAEILTSKSPVGNDTNTGLPNGSQKRQRYISPTSRIKSRLTTFLGGPDVVIYDYLDTICLTLLGRTDNTTDIEDIRSSISKLQKLEKDARIEEGGILQYHGVGPKLVQAEVTSRDIHNLLSGLEEVYIYSLSGIAELAIVYDQTDLLFQSW
ncbi:hypothetical protein CY34DRAFT_19807 [Suillus luteus UH-Slu-Lm8-n1]|uniref:Uncharacterized protein n=1 Tax=Suillus luteus UH-Slu-Lm8-n1 TaxID=930992 RepID=A0A0D0AHS8_9AGAM|nr:hypothetical protein CY34DRAFT_19807 [Suillus luteus UH-Slu-Lm8-n1]